MLEDFETIQIVLYLPEAYMMDLETSCNVSCVTCHMSLFKSSQTVRTRDLKSSHNSYHTLCVICPVSHVIRHMSLVMCHVARVTIFSVFLKSVGVSWWRLFYHQGLPRLFKTRKKSNAL